ncbi:MAG: DUF4160 domain-containing protein [Bacilli bacterium]|nr:DUF4160 domain-containing protein [Bacilli bacterium]
MYFKDHNPPHIHVSYGDYNAIVGINDSVVLDGSLPQNALRMVKEWVLIHKDELIKVWNEQKFSKIAPLQ